MTTGFIAITKREIEIQKIARYEDVEFEGNVYRCRIIKDKNGEDLLIGSYELNDALRPGEWEGENEGFASEEASNIYDDIFYFMAAWDVEFLYDEELISELRESNPDWFD